MTNRKTPRIRFKGFTDDWEQRKLGDCCNIYSGFMGDSLLTDGQYRLTRIETIADGTINESRVGYANTEPGNDYKLTIGDILFSNINSLDHIGKIAQYRENTGLYHGINLLRIVPNNVVSPEFLFYELLTQKKRNWAQIHANQAVSQASINRTQLEEEPVELCSLAEQQKIGAYFKSLDHLITLHQREYEKLHIIKKSMLENCFPKKGERAPKIRFSGFTGDWEQRKVSDEAEIITGGTPSTKVPEYWNPPEIPWLSSGEVHKKYITETDNLISRLGFENSSAQFVKKNSVLIALAGQGKTRGTVAINRIPLTTNQSIAAMTFNEGMYPDFVFSNLESRYEELRSISSGDGSRGGLNKQLVGDVIIPYPSFDEQKAIGNYFKDLNNLITLHQHKLEKLGQIKRSMLDQMFI